MLCGGSLQESVNNIQVNPLHQTISLHQEQGVSAWQEGSASENILSGGLGRTLTAYRAELWRSIFLTCLNGEHTSHLTTQE